MPAPNTPQDLIDRIRALERQVRQLSGRANIRPALTEIVNGNVNVGGGGELSVTAPDNTVLFKIGELGASGGSEWGMVLRRRDGTVAFEVYSGFSDESVPQPVRVFDRFGSVVFGDDTATGGIRSPQLPYLMPVDLGYTRGPQTDSSSWTAIATSFNLMSNPRMRMYIDTAADSSTSGEVRVMVNGQQWGPVVGSGTAFDYSDVIQDGLAFEQMFSVTIEARVTSGAGRVYARCSMMHGYGELA